MIKMVWCIASAIVPPTRINKRARTAFALAVFCALSVAAQAQTCGNRGELDIIYCDENRDLVADSPRSQSKFKDPAELIFSYSPIEDPMMFAKMWRPFADYLGRCVGKPIRFRAIQTNTTEVDALRTGNLHIAAFSTGATGFAVNLAGAVPFAAKGVAEGIQDYRLSAVKLVRDFNGIAYLNALIGRCVGRCGLGDASSLG